MKKLLVPLAIGVAAAVLFVSVVFIGIISVIGNTVKKAVECGVGLVIMPAEIAIDVAGTIIGGGVGDVVRALEKEQLNNAGIIIGVGKARGLDRHDVITALMVALQESNLINLTGGDRDSAGIFQQRPSQGWGTKEQVTDPVYASNKFFEALEKIGDRDQKSYLDLALAVQRPDPAAYDSPQNRFTDKQDVATALFDEAAPTASAEVYGNVQLIGDSLTAQTENFDTANMQQFGWQNVVVDAQSGRHIAIDSQNVDSGLTAIRKVKQQGGDGAWVIALGTNDVASVQNGSSDPVELIGRVIKEVGYSADVLWVNTYLPSFDAGARSLNAALAEAAKVFPNLKIADWYSLAQRHPEWLSSDGVHYTTEGSKQRSYFVAGASRMLKVATSQRVIVGDEESQSASPKGICDRGASFIARVTGGAGQRVGTPVTEDDPIIQAGGIVAWSFGQAGLSIGTTFSQVKSNSIEISGPSEAKRGDVIFWSVKVRDEISVGGSGLYLGDNQVILDPKPGETVTVAPIDWSNVYAILRPSSNEVPPGYEVTADTPLDQISNPALAQIGANFETIVGGQVYYGAARQKWIDKGRKGNFGHGNKQQWLDDLRYGPDYYSLDCSGLTNMVVYLAYGVDLYACSHDYKDLSQDGKPLTAVVMEDAIDPTKLHEGDFIIERDQPCGSTPDDINHIIMVVSVSGSDITTVESSPSAGVAVNTRRAEWYNANWPTLVVSRWIGPGAESLVAPVSADSSTSVPESPPSTS